MFFLCFFCHVLLVPEKSHERFRSIYQTGMYGCRFESAEASIAVPRVNEFRENLGHSIIHHGSTDRLRSYSHWLACAVCDTYRSDLGASL